MNTTICSCCSLVRLGWTEITASKRSSRISSHLGMLFCWVVEDRDEEEEILRRWGLGAVILAGVFVVR